MPGFPWQQCHESNPGRTCSPCRAPCYPTGTAHLRAASRQHSAVLDEKMVQIVGCPASVNFSLKWVNIVKVYNGPRARVSTTLMPPRRKQHIVGASKPTSGRTRRAARAYKTPRREPAPPAEPAPAPAGAADPHPVPTEDFNAMCFDLTLGSENHAHRTHTLLRGRRRLRPRSARRWLVHREQLVQLRAQYECLAERSLDAQREVPESRGGACERHGVYVIPLLGWAVQRRGRRANRSAAPLHHCKYVGKLAGGSARCHELATQGISTGFAAAAENFASSVGATAELTFLSSIQQIRGSGARFWRPSHERTRTAALSAIVRGEALDGLALSDIPRAVGAAHERDAPAPLLCCVCVARNYMEPAG
ncbi:hypothetical protein B0H13DRAFT_2277321 [Mycena leptocephala]|nr:hypothetical protein B0H13DRAFT_2277321 [Mycena leptocephala]